VAASRKAKATPLAWLAGQATDDGVHRQRPPFLMGESLEIQDMLLRMTPAELQAA